MVAATCSDDKSAEKFKKLMGIKEGNEKKGGDAAAEKQKQAELFRNLDMQYESARMSIHTHCGVGLGFFSQMMELAAQAKAAQESQTLP